MKSFNHIIPWALLNLAPVLGYCQGETEIVFSFKEGNIEYAPTDQQLSTLDPTKQPILLNFSSFPDSLFPITIYIARGNKKDTITIAKDKKVSKILPNTNLQEFLNDSEYVFKISIDKLGKINSETIIVISTGWFNHPKYVGDQLIPWDEVQKSIVTNCLSIEPRTYDNNIVYYDPCCNCITFKRSKTKRHGNKLDENSKKYGEKSGRTEYFNGQPYKRFFTVKEGATLLIHNLNPYKYEIAVNSSDTSYNELGSDILTDLFSTFLPLSLNPESTGKTNDLKNAILDNSKELEKYITYINSTLDCITEEQRKKLQDEKKTIENRLQHYSVANSNYSNYLALLNGTLKRLQSQKDPDTSKIIKAIGTYKSFLSVRFDHNYQYNIIEVPNVDEIILEVTIKTKDKQFGINVNKQKVRIPVKGGFKIDFSPGIYFGFNMASSKYYIYDSIVPPPIKKHIVSIIREEKDSRNLPEFGVSSLIHFYSRWGLFVNVSATFGMAVPINEKPLPRFLLGGSLLLGRTNRISITGGVVFGWSDKISEKYKFDELTQTFENIPYKLDKIEYTQEMRYGGFVSLSYNIPLIKRTDSIVKSSSKK